MAGLDLHWTRVSEEQDLGRHLRPSPDLQERSDLHLAERPDLCRPEVKAQLSRAQLHALVEILLKSSLVRAGTVQLTLPHLSSWIFATYWLD